MTASVASKTSVCGSSVTMLAVPAPTRMKKAPTPNRKPGGDTTPSSSPSTTASSGTVRLARDTTSGEMYLRVSG